MTSIPNFQNSVSSSLCVIHIKKLNSNSADRLELSVGSIEKKERFGKFILCLFLSFALPTVTISGFNYFVDPYDIFNNNFVTKYDFNPRYTKLKKASEQKNISGVLFGSCLSSTLDTKKLEHGSGYKYFNFSTHLSLTREPLVILKALKSQGHNVRQVLLNVDNYLRPLEVTKEWEESQLKFKLNSKWPSEFENGEKFLNFFATYLFSEAVTSASIDSLKKHLNRELPSAVEKMTGEWEWIKSRSLIQKNYEKFLEKIFSVTKYIRLGQAKEIPEESTQSFQDLERLKAFTQINKIELKCFIPPSWALRPTFPWQYDYSEWQFRKILELCGEFHDFRWFNEATFDVDNFYTYENFNEKIGDRVIYDLFESDLSQSQFFYRVKPKNFNDYIIRKRNEAYVFNKEIFPLINQISHKDLGQSWFKDLYKKFN